MNTNWIGIVILYGWLLSGLFVVKMLKNGKNSSSYQVLLSFFIGPFGFGWIWIQENRDKLKGYLDFKKRQPKENTDYLNLVFLDNHSLFQNPSILLI